MNSQTVLVGMSAQRIATLIRVAKHRVIFAAPGVQIDTAKAIVSLHQDQPDLPVTVSVDFDERILRMGYGALEGVEALRDAGVEMTHSPGFRCGILIIDNQGWVFTPTALYLEQEPQSDETPNAVTLSPVQVQDLAVRISPEAKQEAIERAPSPEAAKVIQQAPLELGVVPIPPKQFESVKEAIKTAPPVKFDIVRQVRVFEPYLQYVELSLTGAAVQRHRVRIPPALQNLGASEDLEGKLKTTFDLIEKGSALSSKDLEHDLQKIRKNFTPSLGKDRGRVVLKSAKPHLAKRIDELRTKLETHQEKVKSELQEKLDKSRKQVVDYYLPLAKENPPDALLGSLINPGSDEAAIRGWIEEKIDQVFPKAATLIRKMALEDHYKDVTYETLNKDWFAAALEEAFPRIDWDKAYNEFKAVGEDGEGR